VWQKWLCVSDAGNLIDDQPEPVAVAAAAGGAVAADGELPRARGVAPGPLDEVVVARLQEVLFLAGAPGALVQRVAPGRHQPFPQQQGSQRGQEIW